MASKPRRIRFTQQEIQSQLQQLFLFSSLSGAGAGDIDQLGPILLNIHRSKQQDAYLRALKAFVADKEKEIEAVCARNYQDFVGSVSALLRVRQGTVSLKHRVVELNDEVQKSGGGVAEKKKALLASRLVGQNIDEAIDTLQACLRVLDAASKVQNLISNAKYFAALRQLEDLQTNHLKPVLHYPFAGLMLASVPEARASVKEEVTRQLKAWMYEAREASRAVGKGALEAMDMRGRRWNARRRKEPSMALSKINGPVELGVSERHEYNPLENDTVRIDFKPLYTCIHIYDALDAREELQLSYQADRRAQAGLLLSSTTSTTGASTFSLPSLSTLLEELVGFFLIESHVLRTTNSFRSEQDVEDLWDGMCERVVGVVGEGLSNEEDPEVFLGTKLRVLTFVQTLEGYGYSVSQLNALLLTLFERYSQLLQRKFSGDFEQIVLDDDHQPMVVNDAEEFEKVVSVSWLPKEGEWSAAELQGPGFPLALPFSQTYPLCCIDIRSFTEQYYQFSEGFAEHHRDIDDVLRKALDNLLIKQVSENIQRRLTMINNLSQLAQIVVNVLFFQTACSDLEELLVTLRATQRGGTIHLHSFASFDQTLTQTQDRIVAQISQKMDSFFEEAEYPWLAAQPPPPPRPGQPTEASGYLQDLIDFLSTVMMSVLISLPAASKDHVYRGALKHVGRVLQSYLTDRDPRAVSDAGLAYLARDVRWLNEHVASLGNDKLADVFTELNQTLTLLTSHPQITDYLDAPLRSHHFSRVQPRVLQSALVKLLTHYNSSGGGNVGHRRRMGVEDLLRALSR
ncbi:hypothetical protein JCM6882_002826 [Rhodosporidiobolus microsporus]